MSRTYQHLSPEERAVIMIERQNGSSLRGIALRLGRSAANISREVRRCGQTGYNASQAATDYRRRRSRCQNRGQSALSQGRGLDRPGFWKTGVRVMWPVFRRQGS